MVRFDRERFDNRLDEFSRVLARLAEALAQPEDAFMRDAIIQRFEFAFELAWKTMQHWLASKEIDVRNPKDTLRAALEQGLIADGNAWSELLRYRNLTSHTYDEEMAREVVAFVRAHGLDLLAAACRKLDAWRKER